MTTQEKIQVIIKVVNDNHFVSARVAKLRALGFSVESLPMGSGGVLQQKAMKDGSLRIQIGYGVTRYNYAQTVVL